MTTRTIQVLCVVLTRRRERLLWLASVTSETRDRLLRRRGRDRFSVGRPIWSRVCAAAFLADAAGDRGETLKTEVCLSSDEAQSGRRRAGRRCCCARTCQRVRRPRRDLGRAVRWRAPAAAMRSCRAGCVSPSRRASPTARGFTSASALRTKPPCTSKSGSPSRKPEDSVRRTRRIRQDPESWTPGISTVS